jgi:zinc protease
MIAALVSGPRVPRYDVRVSRPRRGGGVPLNRALAIGLTAVAVACASQPFLGDTGIRPFAFDLWDVHCPSGMRVIFERAPASYTAAVTAVVGSGSVQDPPGKEGLAHLVEHLTFRAFGRGANGDGVPLHARLWGLGASYNAETDFDDTTYHEVVPGQSLLDVVELESQRLADPLAGVDETVFAVERDIVRNELRESNETNSVGAVWEAAFRTAFPPGHDYARPIGGTHESISRLTLDDARRFVAAHYRPDNVTMVVVADMDLSTSDAFARAALPAAVYGDPAHPHPVSRPAQVTLALPAPPGGAELRRARASVTTPELWISWTFPGGFGPDLDIARVWSVVTSSNFYWGRFKDTDIADVGLFAVPGVEASLLIARVRLTEGTHPEESLRQVVDAMPWIGGDERYFQHRINNLKLGELRELAFEAEAVLPRSELRAQYAHLTGSVSAYAELVDAIKSIKEDQARDFAATFLGAERARAVLVTPWGADAQTPKAGPLAEDLALAPKREPLPAPTLKNLAGLHPVASLRTSTLDNGLEVVVLRRPGAPVVTATLAFHGDRTAGATGLPDAASAAFQYRLEESPGDYGISYRMDVDKDITTSTVRAGAANVPRALDMLAFGTRSLALDWPSDKFREVRLPFLRRQELAAQVRGEDAFLRALFPTHPFGVSPTVDEIVAHKAGELEDWLGRIVTPHNGVLVIVGDIEPGEAERAARDSLSRLGGSAEPIAAPLPVLPHSTKLGADVLDTPDGVVVTHRSGATQAELKVGCSLPPADVRIDAIHNVTASVVNEWFTEQLRRETGSTYGAHAWSPTWRGGTALLELKAAVDNRRLPLAVAKLRSFWHGFVKDGVGVKWVQRARDAFVTNRLLRYETSGALASELVWRWNQGWPLSSIDEAPALYAAVLPEDVNETLRTCARNLVVAVTGDEATIRAAFAKEVPARRIAKAPPPAPSLPARVTDSAAP